MRTTHDPGRLGQEALPFPGTKNIEKILTIWLTAVTLVASRSEVQSSKSFRLGGGSAETSRTADLWTIDGRSAYDRAPGSGDGHEEFACKR